MSLMLEFTDLRAEIRKLRMAILDEWAGFRTDREELQLHGGNVIADIYGVRYPVYELEE